MCHIVKVLKGGGGGGGGVSGLFPDWSVVLQPSGRVVKGVPYPDWISRLPTIGSLILNISSFTTRRISRTTVVVTPGPIYQLITTRPDC